VHDEIIKAIDSGNVCAVVLLDLSAAYDTVDHQILLQIMNRRFAVAGKALDWCQSYLSHRSQTFCINGQLSGPFPVDCNVPQVSVLGPLKFIGYTEDLADLVNSHQFSHHLYADDTRVIGSTNRRPITAMCCRDPSVVFVKTTADESKEDRIHLVTCQSGEPGSLDRHVITGSHA